MAQSFTQDAVSGMYTVVAPATTADTNLNANFNNTLTPTKSLIPNRVLGLTKHTGSSQWGTANESDIFPDLNVSGQYRLVIRQGAAIMYATANNATVDNWGVLAACQKSTGGALLGTFNSQLQDPGDGNYYMLLGDGNGSPGDCQNLFLWKSSDGITWTIQNSGTAVITYANLSNRGNGFVANASGGWNSGTSTWEVGVEYFDEDGPLSEVGALFKRFTMTIASPTAANISTRPMVFRVSAPSIMIENTLGLELMVFAELSPSYFTVAGNFGGGNKYGIHIMVAVRKLTNDRDQYESYVIQPWRLGGVDPLLQDSDTSLCFTPGKTNAAIWTFNLQQASVTTFYMNGFANLAALINYLFPAPVSDRFIEIVDYPGKTYTWFPNIFQEYIGVINGRTTQQIYLGLDALHYSTISATDNGTSGSTLDLTAGNLLTFSTLGGIKATMNQSGCMGIGIGTSTPSSLLQVGGGITVTSGNSVTNGMVFVYPGDGSNAGYIQFFKPGSPPTSIGYVGYGNGTSLNVFPASGVPFSIQGDTAITGNATVGGNMTIVNQLNIKGSGSVGYVQLVAGDSTDPGYLAWFNQSNTRIGYMGYGTDGNVTLNLNSNSFVIKGGPLLLNGNTSNSLSVTNASSAPSTTTIVLPTTVYGNVTALLANPPAWIIVNVAGTDRKIPCY